jgi:hypothetical protein
LVAFAEACLVVAVPSAAADRVLLGTLVGLYRDVHERLVLNDKNKSHTRRRYEQSMSRGFCFKDKEEQ